MMILSYINTRESSENLKLCENTDPSGVVRVSTKFFVFPTSTHVYITLYLLNYYFFEFIGFVTQITQTQIITYKGKKSVNLQFTVWNLLASGIGNPLLLAVDKLARSLELGGGSRWRSGVARLNFLGGTGRSN
jgi:hypothetical protein